MADGPEEVPSEQELLGCQRSVIATALFLLGVAVGTFGTCQVLPVPRSKIHPDLADVGAWMAQGMRIAVPIGILLGLALALIYLALQRRRSRR